MRLAVLSTLLASAFAAFGDTEGSSKHIVTLRQAWQPRNGNPDFWQPVYPELCETDQLSGRAVEPTESNKVPGYKSKRIAFALRGDSYRGMSHGEMPCYKDPNSKVGRMRCDKLIYYCTPEAVAIQRATVKMQLANFIEPLEKQGYTVDIFLSTYGCYGVPNMTEEKIDELHKGLIEMYNEGKERVVASAFVERKPGQTQDTGVQNTVRLLMTKAPLEYEFIMIWRYDMVMTLSLDESVAVPKKKENQFKQWRQWVKKVKEELFWFADDWGYAFPGYYANCAFSAFMHKCMTNELHCLWGLKANFPGVTDRVQFFAGYDIYRSNFNKKGREMCLMLNKYGGPDCYGSMEEARTKACEFLRATPGLTRIAGKPVSQCEDALPPTSHDYR